MTEPLLMLTAQEAADVTGYVTADRFRRAVKRGVMPRVADPKSRPQLWSRAAIEAKLTPNPNRSRDNATAEIDRAMGLS